MPIIGIMASAITANLATSSFESIATATGTGSSGTITFSSIPSTYKHLQIRLVTFDTSSMGDQILVQFNSDTANNYSTHILRGSGSAAAASGSANTAYMYGTFSNGTDTTYGTAGIIDIIDYASTSKYKTLRSFSGQDKNGSGQVSLVSGLWRSTSAVSTIAVYTETGKNYSTNTKIALYGIKGS